MSYDSSEFVGAEVNPLKNELYELIKTDFLIFDFIQQNMFDGLWYLDLDDDNNEWTSRNFWQLLGYDKKDYKNPELKWQKLVHPDDLKMMYDNMAKHLLNPEYSFDQIIRITHKNNSTVWVRHRGIAIRDASGKPTKMLGTQQDMTLIKQQEQIILEQNRQFKISLDKLKEVTEKDELTSLKNRRYFNKKLKYFVKSAVRYDSPISLVILDIDNFKLYNDSYGHPAGDRVLGSIGHILRENGRDTDIACRIGGEEFAVILTNTDKRLSKKACERFKQSFHEYKWPNEPVTASFGIASMHIKVEGDTSDGLWENLYKHADLALYFSKDKGRNTYHHYDDIRLYLSGR